MVRLGGQPDLSGLPQHLSAELGEVLLHADAVDVGERDAPREDLDAVDAGVLALHELTDGRGPVVRVEEVVDADAVDAVVDAADAVLAGRELLRDRGDVVVRYLAPCDGACESEPQISDLGGARISQSSRRVRDSWALRGFSFHRYLPAGCSYRTASACNLPRRGRHGEAPTYNVRVLRP